MTRRKLSALGEWQQCDVACLLDSGAYATLVRRAHASETARNDLPALSDELPEQAHVLVIDVIDLLDAELADLLATEEFAVATRATGAGARTTLRTRTVWTAATWTTFAARTVSTRAIAGRATGVAAGSGRSRCRCRCRRRWCLRRFGFVVSHYKPLFVISMCA
jgi:hypothetical protein